MAFRGGAAYQVTLLTELVLVVCHYPHLLLHDKAVLWELVVPWHVHRDLPPQERHCLRLRRACEPSLWVRTDLFIFVDLTKPTSLPNLYRIDARGEGMAGRQLRLQLRRAAAGSRASGVRGASRPAMFPCWAPADDISGLVRRVREVRRRGAGLPRNAQLRPGCRAVL